MRSRHCLRRGTPAAVFALSAAALCVPAHAGLVGLEASLLWTGGGGTVDEKTFTISEHDTEYRWAQDAAGVRTTIDIDFSEKGMKLTYAAFGEDGPPAAYSFAAGTLFRIDLAPGIVIDSAVFGRSLLVDGMGPQRLSWQGSALTVDMSAVTLQASGALIEIEYYMSPVPGPAAATAMALAGAAARGRRRRA
jgi:hypothetical protein